jgi:hypothetical protein
MGAVARMVDIRIQSQKQKLDTDYKFQEASYSQANSLKSIWGIIRYENV